jgi:hypothetical protein
LGDITTDTGDLAPGNKDFTRYTTPGRCVATAEEATEVRRRAVSQQVRPSLIRTAAGGDSLPAAVRMIARACGERFNPADLSNDGELEELFTLSLWGDQDSVAQKTLERRLSLASGPVQRAMVLRESAEAYLAVPPGRAAAAEAVLARLNALGPAAATARLWAYGALLKYAQKRFDEPLLRRTAEQIITLGQTEPFDSIRYDYLPIIYAHRALGELAYLRTPDSVTAIMVRAKKDLGRFPPAGEFPPGKPWVLLQSRSYKLASVEEVRYTLLPFDAARYAGAPFPPVTAAYWRPKQPEVWPPGGARRPSVVIYGGSLPNTCAREDHFIFGPVWGEGSMCDPLYTMLPYWFAQYGDRLSVTLVAQTAGFAVRSGVLAPAAEADSLAWFFREHLKLPLTVGVVVDSVWTLPAPDGRQFRIDTTFYGRRNPPAPVWREHRPTILLYGVDGQLQFVGENIWSPLLQRLIEREAQHAAALSRPGNTISTPSPGTSAQGQRE